MIARLSLTKPVRRAAFTLIELLVVIAIIAILIALLVPAVQKVREAASRLQCQNNLKNIALAVHGYHDVKKDFPNNWIMPPNYGVNYPNWSWMALILPYIDQGALYSQSTIPTGTLAANLNIIATPIAVFFCPSDSAMGLGTRTDCADLGTTVVGMTNYQGVSGANWGSGSYNQPIGGASWGADPRWVNASVAGSFNGLEYGDGIFYRADFLRKLTLIQITDGTSNTFMVGEDLPSMNQWCAWPYANSANATCAIAPNSLKPNGTPFAISDWPNVYSFRSNHAQGLNFAYADASVHFVSDNIDLPTYRAMATIQGGEALVFD